jgi:MFS family permease
MNNRKSAPPSGTNQPSRYGYVIVTVSFIIVMMNVGMYLTIGVFFKPISQDMGWTRAETSLPISLSTLVTAIMSIIAGSLVDKYGPRKIAFIFAVITGAGYLLMSQLSSLWELYLYFGFLIGAGACLMAPLLSLIPRWFSTSRTVMAGIISAGGGVGGLIMPLVANWLITSFNWHQAYLVMGIIYLVVVLTAVQFLKHRSAMEAVELPKTAAADASAKSPFPAFSFKEAFHSRNYWLMAATVFAFGYVANTINLHSAPNATDIGTSSTAAAGLLSVMNGFSIIGCVVLGLLGDKFGNRKMLVVTFVIEGAALFWLATITHLWMLNVFMMVYGIAFGSGLAQSAPLVAKLFGLRSLGLILSTILFIQTIGAGLGSYVPGLIYDIKHDYYWAFIICGTLCLLAVIATLSLNLKTANTPPAQGSRE